MAREKAERGEALSSKSGNTKKKSMKGGKSFGDDDDDDNFARRMSEMNMNEPPEPEVLLSILHRRTKK